MIPAEFYVKEQERDDRTTGLHGLHRKSFLEITLTDVRSFP